MSSILSLPLADLFKTRVLRKIPRERDPRAGGPLCARRALAALAPPHIFHPRRSRFWCALRTHRAPFGCQTAPIPAREPPARAPSAAPSPSAQHHPGAPQGIAGRDKAFTKESAPSRSRARPAALPGPGLQLRSRTRDPGGFLFCCFLITRHLYLLISGEFQPVT